MIRRQNVKILYEEDISRLLRNDMNIYIIMNYMKL